jgi:hypothetical protein
LNKAFVREPDDHGSRNCPRCGSLGVAVGRETLSAQLKPDAAEYVWSMAFFCPFAQCDVAYFDLFERTISVDLLARPVWPKDPEAPLCCCFGLTRDDIEADVAEGSVRRTRAVIEKARSPEARCVRMAPSGQSCIAQVQRYYMKLRGGTLD